ncbi:Signal transduction histidine kinase [Parelusimicrobium proximum]|uniref:hybrid sensor histidine kinase/response regulator n=1 Tax=Parelusimicrobium proximum TaxID=3228953 RepID=UPI003D183E12
MRLIKNRTIFSIILTACLLSLAVPFILLSYFATSLIHKESASTARANALLVSDSVSSSIRYSLTNTTELLSFTSQALATLDPAAPESLDEASRILNSFIHTDEGIYDAWFIFEKGGFYDDKYFALDFIRENGQVMPFVDNTDERLEDEEGAHWYYRALRSGEIYFDNEGSYDYGEGDVDVFTISAPIKRKGETVGVIGMDIMRRYYYRVINDFRIEGEREIMMISQKGKILYSSRADEDEQNLFANETREKGPIMNAMAENKSYVFEGVSPISGQKALVYITPLNLPNAQQPAFLYIDITADKLYANANKIGLSIAVAALFAGGLLFIGIFFSTRSIVIPIHELTAAANEVAQGNYDVDFGTQVYIEKSVKNEIILLGNSLKKMLVQLKNYIKEKQQFSDTLEQKIEERTQELTLATEESKKAKQKAEEASRAKSDFLASMSHEIRTPINAIMGMTSIGRMSKDIDKKDYCFDKIETASSHLLGIINDILDMSKIEANKLELSLSKFDFEKMLSKIAGVFKIKIDEKKQNLTVKIDDGIPRFILSDEQRLSQVIFNLLSNAIKFTPERGNISVHAGKEGEENGIVSLRIDVRDSGIGISEEQQSSLFRSFQQADNSISRKFGGTGLGLAISRNIIEMLGGKIWVESEKGRGSVFSFVFKTKEVAVKHDKQEIKNKNARILFADNSEAGRESFATISRTLSISPDIAKTKEDALSLLSNKEYDIIFVDSNSIAPSDAASLVKAFISKNPGGLIVCVGLGEETDELRSIAPHTKFIDKPLFPSSVAEAVNMFVPGKNISALPKQEEKTASIKGKHVLLVEDVEINREIFVSLLEDTGIIIDSAEDGLSAIEKFKADPGKYNIIFMDIHMPGIDGYETTRRLRALDMPAAKKVPIIAMTANVFKEDIEKSIASGMNEHLGKPINIEDVKKVLAKYLA